MDTNQITIKDFFLNCSKKKSSIEKKRSNKAATTETSILLIEEEAPITDEISILKEM